MYLYAYVNCSIIDEYSRQCGIKGLDLIYSFSCCWRINRSILNEGLKNKSGFLYVCGIIQKFCNHRGLGKTSNFKNEIAPIVFLKDFKLEVVII